MAGSYYHTAIVYPLEFPKIDDAPSEDVIDNICFLAEKLDADVAISPLHSPEDAKEHYHILFRLSNKQTGNTFQGFLCDALNGNFNGIAYASSQGCVTRCDRVLRYMVHRDNPSKQQFEWNQIFVKGDFNKELYCAFTDEHVADLVSCVHEGWTLHDMTVNGYGYALLQGKNLYLVNSLIKERDILYSKQKG